jgi:hypothetical protein
MADRSKALERMKALARVVFAEEFLCDVGTEQADGFVTLRVKRQFYGLLDHVESVPINWWQAVRERWLPYGWLRRYPVLVREIKVYGAVYFKPSDDPLWEDR